MKNERRELLVGAVGLVKGSVRNGGKVMRSICDEFEPEFRRTCFLEKAPFEVVSLIIRYGTKREGPVLGGINRRHAELNVTVEVPMSEVRTLDESKLTYIVRTLVLESLVEVAVKYCLDATTWKERLKNGDDQ